MSNKEFKAAFLKKASQNPDSYYATNTLKQENFTRKQCTNCSRFFWSTTERIICGDPACSGGFQFLNNTPAKKTLSYIEVWKAFAQHFKERGYEPIQRYPTAARWRDDTDFVQASIYDFQPYVVSGEVLPPANPLVVPQFCLRFNDIDNVGITGAHYTGFVMIGQHAFNPPEKWNQEKYFADIHSWLTKGLGLPNHEITYHEDAWVGGGNFGASMEFFSRGLELGNQVYMQFEQTPSGSKELNLKVLDMGMGHERNAWFTSGQSTSYEAVFPTVCKKLHELSGINYDKELIARFLPFASRLNVDETENVEKEWTYIAKQIDVDKQQLKNTLLPLSALYSIGEHTRTLLVALTDGVLPSNTGGGYNLRVILRRALAFIEKYKWDISLPELADWHAQYLKPLFPELAENIAQVSLILDEEKKKYKENRKRNTQLITSLLKEKYNIAEKELIELYDSKGILPEEVKKEAETQGKQVSVPDNFYALIAERHEQQEVRTTKIEHIKIEDALPATEALFYQDYTLVKAEGKVLSIVENNVVLDKTVFFATSGGQLHDEGKMNGIKVIDVFRQGKYIVHVLDEVPDFKIGAVVQCTVDAVRRKQLSQHHTITHIYNQLLRRKLGTHAWQAGTAKMPEKARLDMTHFASLSDKELKELEKEANDIIKKDLIVESRFEPRTEAEKKYGFAIYQGGVVPGKKIRIVDIKGFDIEACGGTHVKHTGEIGSTVILKTSKIQDGVVRIEYVAGNAAKQKGAETEQTVTELASLLSCTPPQVVGRVKELFELWKNIVKKKRKIEDIALKSEEIYQNSDILDACAIILKTQPEHVVKTAKRFLKDIKTVKKTKCF